MSRPAPLIDSHCHVAEPDFDADRDAVFARAAAHGVGTIVCVGATGDVDRNVPTVALARTGSQHGVEIYGTVGIHPHDAVSADDAAFARLTDWLSAPRIVALGETGLDYYYDHSPRTVQREVFARTIALARSQRVPLVVHVREAHAEAADLLRAERHGDVRAAIHCFTGDGTDARRYLDLGCTLSISGIVTFKTADALREAVRIIPADRLMVETDAPYLSPVPHRGKRNEPAHIGVVAAAVAGVRGEEPAAVTDATTMTARRFFGLPRD